MLNFTGDVMNDLERRIDPEPIAIFMALMATYAASIASLNYVKSHRRPIPSQTRRSVVDDVTRIQDSIRQVTTDLETIRQIFSTARFVNGNAIKLGNGAYLSYGEFTRYERTSASVFRTLGNLHRTCLKLERHALTYIGLEMFHPTNQLGKAYELFEALRTTRDLSVEKAWDDLSRMAELIESACEAVRKQIDHDEL